MKIIEHEGDAKPNLSLASLHASEEAGLLVDFFEYAPMGLHWAGADGSILRVNRAELDMLGYSREEYIGRNIREFHIDPRVIDDMFERLSRGEVLYDYDARLISKDGSVKHVLINASAYFKNGTFMHVRCFTRDITERQRARERYERMRKELVQRVEERTKELENVNAGLKKEITARQRAEKILQESEELYRQLIEAAPDIIAAMGVDGTIKSLNPAWEKIMEWPQDEWVGKSFFELVHPEDIDRALAYFQKLVEGESPEVITIRFRTKSGGYKYLEATTRPIFKNEHAVGMLGIIRDVTERLEAEQAVMRSEALLTEAQKISNIGSWEWDIPNNILSWSAELYRIYGLELEQLTVTYQGFLERVHPDDRALVEKAVNESRESGGSFEFEHRIVRFDGEIRWLRARGHVVKNSSGISIRMVGTGQDITKEKEIDRAKSEFVSLASHQLRTPLSILNWHAEVLLEMEVGALNERQKKLVEEIYRASRRMVALVGMLLNVAKIELGTLGMNPQAITNVVDVLRNIFADLRREVERKHIEIRELYDPAVPAMNVDPRLVEIILQNIIVNAVRYTPPEGRISVSTSYQELEKTVLLMVADTGYGIPDDEQEQVFKKSFRARNVKEVDNEGTGLGLYLVKAIVDRLGGSIWVESKEGRGSTFFVSLPVR